MAPTITNNLAKLMNVKILVQLIIGILTSIFVTILICCTANNITTFLNRFLYNFQTLLVVIHLSIIVIAVMAFRLILNTFITDTDVFDTIFCIIGPTITATSIFFIPYVKTKNTLFSSILKFYT
jgi:hypothetical protein